MAVLALAAAGAATGAAIGGAFLGVTAASWGWMAGSLLGNALFGGSKSQGPRLGDLKFTGTEYGQPVPWVAGAPRISGQVIWASTKRELAKTESVGKGGGSEYTSYTYEIDLLILLAENVTAGVGRVWSNGELVKDATTERDDVWHEFTAYTGAVDQLPDPTYEAAVGLGNAPAYRGRTTVLIRGLQLGNSGQLPNLTFEISQGTNLVPSTWYAPGNTPFPETGNENHQFLFSSYSSYFANSYVLNESFMFGRRYVEIKTGASSFGRGWFFGAYSQSYYSGAYGFPGNPYSIGAKDWFVTNSNYYGADPADIVEGVSELNAQYDIDWSNSVFGIEINYSAGSVSVYRNGNLLKKFFSGYYDLLPAFLVYASDLHVYSAEICRAKESWQYAPAGVRPFNRIDGPGSVSMGSLQDVVDQLMARAGYNPDEWNSSDLAAETRPVRAMALAQVGTTRAALETLASAYFFHASKGDQIVFRRRASATPQSIDWDDLATAEDATSAGEPFALNTGSDMEVPAQVALSYPNMAGDYSAATEHSARLLGAQDSTQAVQLGLGMLPAEAKLVADALLFDQVTAMVTAQISLPPTYSHLQAGDVLLVPDGRGRTHRMLVDKRTDTALVAQLDLRQDDPTAFESEAITDTGYALTDAVRQLAPTWWQALDVPLLRDGDDAPGYYVAMAPNKANAADIWRGSVFVRAWLPEQWEPVAEADDAATLGATTSALPAWAGRNVMDESTVLTVRVSGQLASTTRDALQADRTVNVLLVGSEVLRFRRADLLGTTDGENDYRLTGLLRAQLGTEWAATAGSASGARVVLLSGALRRVTDQPSQIGVSADIKAVSRGLLLSSATAEAFTNTGVCLRPLAPVHLRAVPAGADLSITWQRRTRLGYRYGGSVGVSVPLGEESEAYRVRIYSGATLLRTLDATTPAATYTAAQQAADGLASGAAITLQVVQRSAAVGDGYATTLETTTP